jgi:Serine dehydrogenase proteinase
MTRLLERVKALEQARGSIVMVYFLNDEFQLPKLMESSDVRWLYQALHTQGTSEKLDVVLHCRGGSVSVAHKIYKLLRHYSKELNILIPYKAHSAATLLCLGADHLVMTPLSELSPLDPHLGSQLSDSSQPIMMSSEDIRAYAQLAQDWFGLTTPENKTLVFKLLSERVFPPTLGTFYRSSRHMATLAHDLLSVHYTDAKQREPIIQKLISGYHSHDFAIGLDEARTLGLAAQAADKTEERLLMGLWESCLETLGTTANGLIAFRDFMALHTVNPIESQSEHGTTIYFDKRWAKL